MRFPEMGAFNNLGFNVWSLAALASPRLPPEAYGSE
jgi:hypothetical protein